MPRGSKQGSLSSFSKGGGWYGGSRTTGGVEILGSISCDQFLCSETFLAVLLWTAVCCPAVDETKKAVNLALCLQPSALQLVLASC